MRAFFDGKRGPRKSLGQNFLFDKNIIRKIASVIDRPPGWTVEIGPGLGSLTSVLLDQGHRVQAYEIDRGLYAYLAPFQNDDFRVHHADFLKADLDADLGGYPFAIAANIPYQITTPILKKAARLSGLIEAALLIQAEVAGRICALPGSKEYGFLTILANLYFDCRRCFNVGGSVFFPRPKIGSTVIHLKKKRVPYPENEAKAILKLADVIFKYRRKTLVNALREGGIDVSAADLNARWGRNVRGETLSVEDLALLGRQLRLL